MFDNKNTAWSKSVNLHKELQTKEQVQEEVYKQALMAEEAAQQSSKRSDYSYQEKGSTKQSDKRGGGSKREDKPVYLAKQSSFASTSSAQTPTDVKKGKPNLSKTQSVNNPANTWNDGKSPEPKGKKG